MPHSSHKTIKDIQGVIDDIVTDHTPIEKQPLNDRETLLAVLSRAADDCKFLRRMSDDPHEALKEYYTLTSEEKAALASGDIKQIEAWVGKLDEKLATWLWCRLSQEKW